MLSRRGPAAIVAAAAVAAALTAACSLTTSTDGLSTGGPLPADATADRAFVEGGAEGPDAADAHPFPPEAQTWPGNGHGYAVYVLQGGVTWTDARMLAEQAGGHLATLGSSAENDFVMNLCRARSDAFDTLHVGPWLGGYQDNPTPADEPAGKWRWVDGTPWAFTSWATGQPDNSANIENYLGLYTPDGVLGWNDDALAGNPSAVLGYVVEYE